MKKLAIIAAIALVGFYGYPNMFAGLFAFGNARFAISDHDPLGTPEKLDEQAIASGFDGDFGTKNTVRTISYANLNDDKLYPGLKGGLDVQVGEEEYVTKITGTFLGSTHGPSPMRMTPSEAYMQNLWLAFGGPKKPNFERKTVTDFTIPKSVKFGKAIKVNATYRVATFETSLVKGRWVYEEDRSPIESIQFEVK